MALRTANPETFNSGDGGDELPVRFFQVRRHVLAQRSFQLLEGQARRFGIQDGCQLRFCRRDAVRGFLPGGHGRVVGGLRLFRVRPLRLERGSPPLDAIGELLELGDTPLQSIGQLVEVPADVGLAVFGELFSALGASLLAFCLTLLALLTALAGHSILRQHRQREAEGERREHGWICSVLHRVSVVASALAEQQGKVNGDLVLNGVDRV